MLLDYLIKPSKDDYMKAFQDCKKTTFKKGEFLFHMGDSATHLDLIVEGKLQIFKYSPNMNEATLHYFTPVSIVAEWAIIQGIPYPASARFTEKSTVIRMDLERFKKELNHNILLNHILIHSLMMKIQNLNVAIDRGLTMDSLQRVAHFLYYCTNDCLELKQNQISSLLYLRPETFSRVLKQLKELNYIDIIKGKIAIKDRDSLLKFIL